MNFSHQDGLFIIILMQRTITNYKTIFYTSYIDYIAYGNLNLKKRKGTRSFQYQFINYSKIIIKRGSKQGDKTSNYLHYFQLMAAAIPSDLKTKAMSAKVLSHEQLLN